MAKIYQTQTDVERERLSNLLQKVDEYRGFTGYLTGAGIGALIMGLIKKNPPHLLPAHVGYWEKMWEHIRRPIGGSQIALMGGFVTGLGAIGLYALSNMRHKMKDDLAKLGPEEVILPPVADAGNGSHVLRLQQSCGCDKAKSL